MVSTLCFFLLLFFVINGGLLVLLFQAFNALLTATGLILFGLIPALMFALLVLPAFETASHSVNGPR